MNCLEYRRLMETAPAEAGAEAHEHARGCPSCADLGRRAARLDRLMQRAVRVPLPENLEARILMRQSFDRPQRPRARHRAWAALAAGLLLAVAVAWYGVRVVDQEARLHEELVALVEMADYALEARGPVRSDALSDALRPVGLGLREPVGTVSFAGRCLVRGNLSGHLVIRESATPVSVFLMPDEHVSRTSSFRRDGWHGIVAPAGRGTVGMVVPGEEHIDPALLERMLRAVRWRS